jgi:predicted nucleic acid-binding protein
MILVDTSVWIAYFNGEASRQTDMLDALIGQEPVATGDLIITEVLRGFWLENDYETVKRLLTSLTIFNLAGEEIAIKSADNCHHLSREGINIRKPLNAIIATFCIENDLPLLFSDKDFEPFTAHLNLRAVI